MKTLIGFILGLGMMNTYALDSDDLLHPVAHMGGSYVITHITEVVCKKVSSQSRLTCSLIGAGAALVAGGLVEATQGADSRDHMRGMLQNTLGAGLAVGIINLDF